jgi:protein-disulfide isomerase
MILNKENHDLFREVKMAKKSNEIKINKVGLWKVLSAVLVVLLFISIYTDGFKGDVKSKDYDAGGAVVAQPRQAAPSKDLVVPSIDMKNLINKNVKGDKDAPITIIEWSDFECPYCTKFYSQTLGQIEKEYIDTGKVKFVYRDFPLRFHANAQKAAEASKCAGDQGKFWEMHDILFEKGVKGGVGSFKGFAIELGLNSDEFNECLDSGEMAAEVQKDLEDGMDVGVKGTPGFIINGQLISGAQPFAVFKQIIEAELAK